MGHLVTLAPAHQWPFFPLDVEIGHHRRHSKAALAALVPEVLGPTTLVCLDAAGVATSAANRWLLHQRGPTRRQILFWDRRLIPCSRVADRLLTHRFGRSVLGVWRREGATGTDAG